MQEPSTQAIRCDCEIDAQPEIGRAGRSCRSLRLREGFPAEYTVHRCEPCRLFSPTSACASERPTQRTKSRLPTPRCKPFISLPESFVR